MAVQNSLYTFRNKLGNVRGMKFRNLEPTFVGLLGGPTRDQILNEPEFVRTRENMSEFGGSSHVARVYRVGVAALSRFMESYFSGSFNSRMLIVCQNGVGARGERAITISTNQPLLEFIPLNSAQPFNSISSAPYTMSSNVARNVATLSLGTITPSNVFNAPAGATHYQLLLNVVGISDYIFDAVLGYVPVSLVVTGQNLTATGAILPLNINSASQTIPATIPGTPTMTNATMFTTIGIQFYQQINAVFYLLAQNNAAQIDMLF